MFPSYLPWASQCPRIFLIRKLRSIWDESRLMENHELFRGMELSARDGAMIRVSLELLEVCGTAPESTRFG